MLSVNPSLVQLFQSGFLAGIVTFLLGIVTPFAERYLPIARTSAPTHDATLRLLNLLLNVGLALAVAAAFNQLAGGPSILAAIGLGIAQTTGSHVLYDVVHPSAASSSPVSPIAVDPATLVNAAVSAASQALTDAQAQAQAQASAASAAPVTASQVA